MSKYLLVFGSLRKHSKRGFNYDRFGKGSQKYLKTIWLNGWQLWDLGAYPAISRGANESKIKCELQEVRADAYEKICEMERYSGYQETQIDVDGIKATLFYMESNELAGCPLVSSGDWK